MCKVGGKDHADYKYSPSESLKMGFGIKNMKRSESTEKGTILRTPERIMLVPNACSRRQGVHKQKRICLVASAPSSSPIHPSTLVNPSHLSILSIVRCVPGLRPIIHRTNRRWPPLCSCSNSKSQYLLGQEITIISTLLHPDPLLLITKANTRTLATSLFQFVSAFLVNRIPRDRLPAVRTEFRDREDLWSSVCCRQVAIPFVVCRGDTGGG